jgi:hypothetical protein
MSWRRWTDRAEEPVDWEALDPTMKEALGDFKASVRLWSESAYNRQRPVRDSVARRSWRLAAGWGLAVLLIGGTVSGGLYDRHHMQMMTRLARERAAEQQRQLAAQHAEEIRAQEEDMLASMDGDVSREVPSAMEPLAQLPDEAESQ